MAADLYAQLRALRTVFARRDAEIVRRVREQLQELRADAQAAVQAERAAREAGDANLQAQIDAIVGGSP